MWIQSLDKPKSAVRSPFARRTRVLPLVYVARGRTNKTVHQILAHSKPSQHALKSCPSLGTIPIWTRSTNPHGCSHSTPVSYRNMDYSPKDIPCNHRRPDQTRPKDQHIMDKVVGSGAFTTLQLQQINRCRLYLDISTVSDLTAANGKFIDTAISQGCRTILSSVSRWQKTNQARPSFESWIQWIRVCCIRSCRDGSLFSPLTL
jgi:hypothetical protein